MPQAIAAAWSWAGSVLGGTAYGGVAGALAQSVAWSAISFGVQSAFRQGGSRSQGNLIDLELNSSSPRRMLVGKRMVGGVLADWYLSGDANKKIYLPIYLGEGPCGDITRVFAGGREIHSTPLVHGVKTAMGEYRDVRDRLWVTYYDGRAGQTADTTLVGLAQGWTSTHTMEGCAYVVVEAHWSDAVLRTPPSLSFEMEGATLYDRRKDTTAGGSGAHRLDDPSTWEYSDNPAVALDHYMLGRYWNGLRVMGVGLDPDDVPYARFAAQANVCDETVALKAGGTQKRYRAHGLIFSDDEYDTTIKKLCTAMAASPADFGGRFGTVGIEAKTPVLTIDQGDLITGMGDTYTPKRTWAALVGAVEGRYQPADRLYQPTDYPRVTNAAWEAEDGGEPKVKTLDLEFETDGERAQRLALLDARLERRQATLTGAYPLWAIELERGDWFVRTGGRFGEIGKTFEVMQRVIDVATMTVSIVAQEVDPADSAWDETGAIDPPPALTPSTASLGALETPVLTVADNLMVGAGSRIPALRVGWETPTDERIRNILIEIRRTSDNLRVAVVTTPIPDDDDELIIQNGINEGVGYTVRARYMSAALFSAWSSNSLQSTGSTFEAGAADNVPWSGVTDDGGRPDDDADVTGSNISAGITGQDWGATASEDEAANTALNPVLGNLIPAKWQVIDGTNYPGVGVARCFRQGTSLLNPFTGEAAFKVVPDSPPGGSVYVYFAGNQTPQVTELEIFLSPGVYLLGVDCHLYRGNNTSAVLHPQLVWDGGSLLSSGSLTTSGTVVFDLTGQPARRYQLRINIDDLTANEEGTLQAWIYGLSMLPRVGNTSDILPVRPGGEMSAAHRLASVGWDADETSGNISAGITGQGVFATLNDISETLADASNLLRFSSGGLFSGDLDADLTSGNISAGIVGQTAFATAVSVSLASGLITDKTGANITYSAGGSLDSLKPQEAGANATEGRIAAGITGQDFGATAAESIVRNSLISIGTDGSLTGAGGGQVTIGGLGFVGDLNADETSANISAGITGQTAWATFSGAIGDLASLSFVQVGTTVRLADGTTVATEAMIVTASGIAAGITGQGAGATADAVAELEVDEHPFPVGRLDRKLSRFTSTRDSLASPVASSSNMAEVSGVWVLQRSTASAQDFYSRRIEPYKDGLTFRTRLRITVTDDAGGAAYLRILANAYFMDGAGPASSSPTKSELQGSSDVTNINVASGTVEVEAICRYTGSTTANQFRSFWRVLPYGGTVAYTVEEIEFERLDNANRAQQWEDIGGTGKPDDDADVTSGNIAAGFTGQGGLAIEDSISTDLIDANAVTSGAAEETDGDLTVTTSWQDAETLTITVPSGAEVDLSWSWAQRAISSYVSNDPGGYIYVRLLRGATEIYSETLAGYVPPVETTTSLTPSGGGSATLYDTKIGQAAAAMSSGMDIDAPSAGTHTYKLQVKKSGGPWIVSKRRLKSVLRKR